MHSSELTGINQILWTNPWNEWQLQLETSTSLKTSKNKRKPEMVCFYAMADKFLITSIASLHGTISITSDYICIFQYFCRSMYPAPPCNSYAAAFKRSGLYH